MKNGIPNSTLAFGNRKKTDAEKGGRTFDGIWAKKEISVSNGSEKVGSPYKPFKLKLIIVHINKPLLACLSFDGKKVTKHFFFPFLN